MNSSIMELRCLIKAFFAASCILLCVIGANADVTCTAGIFVAGSQGVVRCDFGTDVTKDKHNFNVVRYDFDDTSYSSRKNLLACSWYIDRLDCTVKAPGYEFDQRVDSTLTLTIPVVDKNMTGLYRCQLVPKPPDIDMHFCNFTVIEKSVAGSPETQCHTTVPRQENKPDSNQAGYPTSFISTLAILLLVVVVAGFAIGLLVFLRCRNKSAITGNNGDHQSCVSKCCCDLCERVANCFKLPVPSSNADQLTENTEEGQALTGAGANTVNTASGAGNVNTAVGMPVTEDLFRVPTYAFSATYVTPSQEAVVQPGDVRLYLPSLTKEPPRPFHPKRETTTDDVSSAHKKSPLPGGREKAEEAEGLLGHNPKSTSERPEGTAWYTETERAHDDYLHFDVKDVERLGAEKPATSEYKDDGWFRKLFV